MTAKVVKVVKADKVTIKVNGQTLLNSYFLPNLFKKTSTGAIQYWTISVYEDSDHSTAYIIQTDYGQVGTDNPQVTYDTIYEGKNVGKKNETSVREQAFAEATAKWEKQQKKGYVNSIDMAEADGLSSLIEGGIVPMLAHKFTDHAHKIKYPCYAQPKLDGIRCIAILKDGKCTLWSRTRKRITGVPHIQREVERLYGKLDVTLDGELYNHDLKKDFEKIVSVVRQEIPQPGHEIVQYHIYDVVTDRTFEQRWNDFFTRLPFPDELPQYCFLVSTGKIHSEDEVQFLFEAAVKKGFEGLMLRNADSKYANKRSYDLQKVKEFDDAEFAIVGVEEGRGKLAGHAIFVCKTESGKEFLAKMKGETARLKDFFDDHTLWKGKKLTVKYQGLTGANGVPRFPIGVAIRDYE